MIRGVLRLIRTINRVAGFKFKTFIMVAVTASCIDVASIYLLATYEGGNPVFRYADRTGLAGPQTILLSVIIVSMIAKVSVAFLSTKMNYDFGHALSREVYSTVLNIDLDTFYERNSNEYVANLLIKINQCIGRIIRPFSLLVVSVIFGLMMFGYLAFTFGRELFIIVAVILVFYFVTFFTFAPFRRNGSAAISASTDALSKLTRESLDSLMLIRLQRLENVFLTRFIATDKVLRSTSEKLQFLGIAPRHLLEGILFATILLIFFTSSATQTEFAALVFGLAKLIPSSQQVYMSLNSMESFRAQMDDVLSIITSEKYVQRNHDKQNGSFSDALKVRNLKYRYHGGVTVRSESLRLERGCVNALRGPSGSGKSTLLDCLIGLKKPTSQYKIFFGHHEIEGALLPEALTDFFGGIFYLPQQYIIFEGTVASNIALDTRCQVDLDLLERVISTTGLKAVTTADAKVSEGGRSLSGGQRQRLLLARALYACPAGLLIIDEGFSALDADAQRLIMASIKLDFPELTILIIFHGGDLDAMVENANWLT